MKTVKITATKSGEFMTLTGPSYEQGLTPEEVRKAVEEATRLVLSRDWWKGGDKDQKVEVSVEV
jgi:hypothetical protein